MNANENNRNGHGSMNTTPVAESSEPTVSQGPIRVPEPIDGAEKAEPVIRFAARTAVKGAEGISKGKLILLGGGLAVAVLFFVFAAIVGKSPKKLAAVMQPSQQAKQEQSPKPKGSVTPLMDTVHTPAPDNSSGQLGPGDIRRTRTLGNSPGTKPFAGKPAVASSLGNVKILVYSLAIAVIPFIAKRIVSGDVGSTAVAMVGTAVTALTAGAAGIEGAAAGVAAARAGSAGATSAGSSSGAATAGSGRALTSAAGGNQPAAPQQIPAASSSSATGFSLSDGGPSLESHADQIRNSISDVMGPGSAGEESNGALTVAAPDAGGSQIQSSGAGATSRVASRSSAATRKGPSVHRYNLGTWTAYHAARIAAGSIAGATKRSADQE